MNHYEQWIFDWAVVEHRRVCAPILPLTIVECGCSEAFKAWQQSERALRVSPSDSPEVPHWLPFLQAFRGLRKFLLWCLERRDDWPSFLASIDYEARCRSLWAEPLLFSGDNYGSLDLDFWQGRFKPSAGLRSYGAENIRDEDFDSGDDYEDLDFDSRDEDDWRDDFTSEDGAKFFNGSFWEDE